MSDNTQDVQLEPTSGVKRPACRRNARGMTTAEYAVGTVAAVTFAGVLILVFKNQKVFEILLEIILWLLRFFTGLPIAK